MSIVPEILRNPNNSIFNLEEAEIYSFKEAHELIALGKYSYSLFALWNSVVINIQRRIENFGIENLKNIIKQSEYYNADGNSLKDRWLNINEFNLIDYALKLAIINHSTHDLISTLYWMKSNTNIEEIKEINEEEIYSLLYLIEKNLFLKKFKSDKRFNTISKESEKEYKRRKDDKEKIVSTLSNTHQELLLKSSSKLFNQDKNLEEEHLLSKYI
ncbi:MAG: hypothetical protein ACNI25_12260 [Halarcobacter sp.]